MGSSLSHCRGGRRRRRGNDEIWELCTKLIKELKMARNSLNCDQEEDSRKRLIKFFESLLYISEMLEDTQKKHMSLLDQIKVIRGKVQKKLSWAKKWRKVSKVLSTVLAYAIHTISVVVVSVVAPPLAPTVSAPVFVLLEPLRNSVDSVWESYEKTFEEQMKLAEDAHAKGDTLKKDLDDIKAAFDEMKMEEAGKSVKALVELCDKTVDDMESFKTCHSET